MIIYKDLVSGDEIISDSYDMTEKDGVVYEIDCKMTKIGGESFDIGANPSAEDADEGVEDSSKQVIDVVHSFRLNFLGDEASGTRLYGSLKDYQGQFKTYLKKVIEAMKANGKSDEDVKKFQSGVQGYFTKVIKPNFKDYDFYVGESMDTDGMVLLLNYREDGITPYFTVWKDGLSEMKV